jgi:hypothetical protein
MRPRFGNKVFLMDTGMLSSYYPGGRASALQVCGEARFTAEYLDQEVPILPAGAASASSGSGSNGNTSDNASVAPAAGGICAAAATAAH